MKTYTSLDGIQIKVGENAKEMTVSHYQVIPEIVGVYDSRPDLTNVIFVCV